MKRHIALEELPDVMQAEEVMAFLQIGRNTMYQLLRSGTFPAVKIGRQYRIPKKLLLSYLDQECYNAGMEGSPDQMKGDVSH